MAANQLWVADITYVMLKTGDVCYLHLITDAYSHKIVGWELADTLRAAITIKALEQAIAQTGGVSLEGLVHHSDRGVQYCCDDYVGILKEHSVRISMTEDYNPTDNAIAERTNGIIKTETVYSRKTFNSIEHARNVIGRFIHFYNYNPPHMSIGYKTPAVVHMETGEQEEKLKNFSEEEMVQYIIKSIEDTGIKLNFVNSLHGTARGVSKGGIIDILSSAPKKY